MSKDKVYEVNSDIAARAHLTDAQYLEMYQKSIDDPESFWAEQAESFVDWFSPWDSVMSVDFHSADIKWFAGGQLNVCYNCVDRHLPTRGDQVAIIWGR